MLYYYNSSIILLMKKCNKFVPIIFFLNGNIFGDYPFLLFIINFSSMVN